MKAKLFFLLLVVLLNKQINAQCWQSISAGDRHSVAIKGDGTLWAWGSNLAGQLGDGTKIDKKVAVQIGTASDWQYVVAKSENTFAIKTDGTLWTWGGNIIIPSQIGADTNWKSISIGFGYVVAIKTDGTLWTWGSNSNWELGIGSGISPTIPTQIGTDTNWQSITVGNNHRIAIKTDGTLWSWGNNQYSGQLGLGDDGIVRRITPTQVGTDTNWQTVSAGNNHTVAKKTDGTLWSWGDNFQGQLGIGNNIDKNSPTKIGVLKDWQSVSAGGDHTLAIKTWGYLFSWGDNNYGQIGNGTNTDIYNNFNINNSGIMIGNSNLWKSVSAGGRHTIALRTNGTAWVWGDNIWGQLGIGYDYIDESTPSQIACPVVLDLDEVYINNNSFSINPNPVKDILTIQNAPNQVIDNIVITDLTGKKVLEQKGNNKQLNIQQLQQGMYLLQVFSEGKSSQSKFIKQ